MADDDPWQLGFTAQQGHKAELDENPFPQGAHFRMEWETGWLAGKTKFLLEQGRAHRSGHYRIAPETKFKPKDG